MARTLLALLLCAAMAGPSLAQPAAPLFTFRAGFWGNLHHFLYVLGRARNGAPDRTRAAVVKAPLDVEGLESRPDTERAAWEAAISFYATSLSKQDAVFDATLVRTTRTLAAASDSSDLSGLGLDSALVDVLTRAAPVYRAVWWRRHSRANVERRDELSVQLHAHGARAVARLTALYGTQWPEQPRTVDLSAYANWAGAYSTDGGLIVMSSTDPSGSGPTGLESLLHEATHQWDEQVIARLEAIGRKQGRPVPGALSHALIFFTSGEIVKEIVPKHVPYGETAGIWNRGGNAVMKPLLELHWRPYLRGTTTFDEAIAAIIGSR